MIMLEISTMYVMVLQPDIEQPIEVLKLEIEGKSNRSFTFTIYTFVSERVELLYSLKCNKN